MRSAAKMPGDIICTNAKASFKATMSSSIRSKKAAQLEEEQLKLKLEQYRSSHKPNKSILKPSGNTPTSASAFKRATSTGCDFSTHSLLSNTSNFRSSQSGIMQSRRKPNEPSSAAAEIHLQVILQKIMTDVNSLGNTSKINEVNTCQIISIRVF